MICVMGGLRTSIDASGWGWGWDLGILINFDKFSPVRSVFGLLARGRSVLGNHVFLEAADPLRDEFAVRALVLFLEHRGCTGSWLAFGDSAGIVPVVFLTPSVGFIAVRSKGLCFGKGRIAVGTFIGHASSFSFLNSSRAGQVAK
jgi:hypothetical protein